MGKDYLDQPLLDLGGGCYATYRDFTQNIMVTGATSSGKSPGRTTERTQRRREQKRGIER